MKCFIIFHAFVRLITSMIPQVLFEILTPAWCHITLWAFVRFFTSMGHHVLFEITSFMECFITFWTFVMLLSCMSSLVLHQPLSSRKGCTTFENVHMPWKLIFLSIILETSTSIWIEASGAFSVSPEDNKSFCESHDSSLFIKAWIVPPPNSIEIFCLYRWNDNSFFKIRSYGGARTICFPENDRV